METLGKSESRHLPEKIRALFSVLALMNEGEVPERPPEVYLEISNLCNFQCAMCSTFSALNPERIDSVQSRGRGFLKLDDKNRGQLAEILPGVLNVHCFGFGEPTLNPQFREYLTFLSQFEVMVDFFTNGKRITAELAEQFVREGVFRVTFSASGANAKQYENVYMHGSYDELLTNIGRIHQEKLKRGSRYPILAVNSIAFSHQVDQLVEFVGVMSEAGVNFIGVHPLLEHSFVEELSGHSADFTSDARRDVLERARQLAAERNVTLWVHPSLVGSDNARRSGPRTEERAVEIDSFRSRAKTKAFAGRALKIKDQLTAVGIEYSVRESLGQLKMLNYSTQISAPCPAPFTTLFVEQGNRIKPCCFWSESAPALGSSENASLAQIWKGPGFESVRSGVARGFYSAAGCGNCIRAGTTPPANAPWEIYNEYQAWHTAQFGTHFETFGLGTVEPNVTIDEGLRHYRVGAHLEAAMSEPSTPAELIHFLEGVPSANEPWHHLIEGYSDSAIDGRLSGWVWSPRFPDVQFPVELRIDGKVVDACLAKEFRQDVQTSGRGDGSYGFYFMLAAEDANRQAKIECYVAGTKIRIPAV